MSQTEVDANRDRRPLYRPGQRVQVVNDSVFQGWQGEVRDVYGVQTVSGLITTYVYHVRMDNLAIQVWEEIFLAPIPDANKEA